MSIAYDFDSEKIREAASSIRKLTVVIDEKIVGRTHHLKEEMEQLRGKSATAMLERIEEMKHLTHKICFELNDIEDDLNRYARAIEAVGEKLLSEV